ncbi:MAG: NAD+ synthase [Candidatus Omnitrophica bacterium]|nr:NAD+ synthase [Candidatus Omnitrophota bacterium]
MNNMRIALAQINTTVGDLNGNRDWILAYADRARQQGADIVAFPELSITGYPPEDLLLKNHFIAANLKTLGEIVKSIRGIVAVVGFVDLGKKGELYNAAAVIVDGKIAGIYHKQALPNYSVFDEKRYFTPGKTAGLFKLGGMPFAVNVCEDIWMPDGVFRAQAKAGAGLILNISSSPYETGKCADRQRLIARVAKATGAHVGYVNLVGGQDELVFDGASMIVSPSGKILASGASFKEDLVICDLPLKKKAASKAIVVKAKLGAAKPVLKARDIKPLEAIEEIYTAVVCGTRDYIQKNGFKRVVIGLSGGIDSALVAAVACDAVGRGNVVGISMPTRYNAEETKSDARLLAQNLGIEFHEVPIERIFESYLETLAPEFGKLPFNSAEENLQSRIRGNILMAFSNKFGWLVLTTGNKSEMATGYCTLYGDMSGGYAVIKDILKTKVYDLCAFFNKKEGRDVIPRSIFTRAPSAELRYDQTDQDSLPPYALLDKLLGMYVEEHQGVKEMRRTCKDEKVVRKVVELVDKSEYKRRQAPPGVKISRRAFGKDWRLPLTNRYKENA